MAAAAAAHLQRRFVAALAAAAAAVAAAVAAAAAAVAAAARAKQPLQQTKERRLSREWLPTPLVTVAAEAPLAPAPARGELQQSLRPQQRLAVVAPEAVEAAQPWHSTGQPCVPLFLLWSPSRPP